MFGSQSTGKSQFLCRHSAEKEREVPGGNCPVGNGTHLCPQRSTIIATLSLFVDDSRPPESLYSNAGWKDDIRWSNRLRLKESRVFPNKTKEVERRKSPHRVFNAISEKTTRVLYTPPHAAGQLTRARGLVVYAVSIRLGHESFEFGGYLLSRRWHSRLMNVDEWLCGCRELVKHFILLQTGARNYYIFRRC